MIFVEKKLDMKDEYRYVDPKRNILAVEEEQCAQQSVSRIPNHNNNSSSMSDNHVLFSHPVSCSLPSQFINVIAVRGIKCVERASLEKTLERRGGRVMDGTDSGSRS